MKSKLFLTQSVTFALEAVRETLKRSDILLSEVEIDGPWLDVDITLGEQEHEDVATRHIQMLITLVNGERVEVSCSVEKVQREIGAPQWATAWIEVYLPIREDGDDVYFPKFRDKIAPKGMVQIACICCDRSEHDGVIRVKMYR